LSILGAAPPALVGWVARVFTGKEGLTVAMRNGLSLYFGDATRAHAKWLSAARVLADPSSQGAWYVDVRLPQRPAVGLAAGTSTSLESAAVTPTQVSASDPTAASLAASLAEAVNGAPAQPTGASAQPTAAAEEPPAPVHAATPPEEATAPVPLGSSPEEGKPSSSTGG
jgi:hypothetical protein